MVNEKTKQLKSDVLFYRGKYNLSMKELAKLANVSLQTICNIENEIADATRMTESKIRIAFLKLDNNEN